MQLRYEQLNTLLEKKPLAPIYFVSGEELLLVQMACDSIRNSAKKQGFSEREVFYAESGFNWHTLLTHANNYGLFSEKQILELHLLQGVSESAAQTLKTYASDPPANKLLLVITGKLDRRLLQTTWFKSIDSVGVFMALWPMEQAQLSRWITERLASLGLKAEKEAIQYLISATEGNLLASAQEIEKLSLYFASDTQHIITPEAMMQALSDNARFDPFKLTDAALQGEAKRCLRILNRLREEGVEPLLILWSLSRECRQLASLAFQLAKGQNLRTLFQTHHIWEKRQPLFQQALQRHSLTHWYTLLKLATQSDRIIKGVISGNIWHALQQLSLQLAGIKPL
ncbi:DNA polymerase III delta subunit [Candidatus Rickettsiella viridis]|uniref:DNA polymerase III subunit delta n=1 Tax=Candidatus Rickettsiella viridis TaxID=676208 RepID=A0A2Z5UTJ9_9COXI|nr:DNA polymerase III subunit delta [Candidatus Rickettsiella viridis]BBB14936.1 DNA polymerase III delta subunit [Candidatus Rickettsiella viridis]